MNDASPKSAVQASLRAAEAGDGRRYARNLAGYEQGLRRRFRMGRFLILLGVLLGAGAGMGAYLYLLIHPAELAPMGPWESGKDLILFLSGTGSLLFGALAALLAKVLGDVERLQQKLREVTIRDPLTGALNRMQLMEDLEQLREEQVRYAGPTFSVLLFDLDHFKRVNDRHGHLVGDEMLVRIVDRVRAGLRGADRLYRFGGEEFIVVAPHTGLDDAVPLAERLRARVADRPFSAGGHTLQMTISIGVAASDTESGVADVGALLRASDAAMYEAKQTGRNRVVAGVPVSPGHASEDEASGQ